MRFSIARLLCFTLVFGIFMGLSFGLPVEIGFPILTAISLFILPPVIIVGVINTRGARQAFFLGCMLAGIGHHVFSLYIGITLSASFWQDLGGGDDMLEYFRFAHLIGISFGLIGGLSGVCAYFLVREPEAIAQSASRGTTIPQKTFHHHEQPIHETEFDQDEPTSVPARPTTPR